MEANDRPLPAGGLSQAAQEAAHEDVENYDTVQKNIEIAATPVPAYNTGEPATQEEILFRLIEFGTDQGKTWADAQVGWSPASMPGQANPACGWAHIACDPYTNEITKINLSNQNLKLRLIPELEQLQSLTELNLEHNQVSGTIPAFLFQAFDKLEYLVMSTTDLVGTLPFGSNVHNHNNNNNNSLQNLRVLDLSANRLRGEIPDNLGDMMGLHLEKLDLGHNGLVGTIPKFIHNCKHLGFLDLSTNLLDGSIPKELGDLKVLKGLFLNNNNLVGTIPFTLARSDLPLIQVFLENNQLSGTIPAGLSDLAKLRDLFVDGNKFTGTLPQDLCLKDPPLNNDFFTGKYATEDRDGCTSIACPAGTVSVEGVAPCFPCDSGQYRYLGREGHQCRHMEQREILEVFYDQANGLNWIGDDGWKIEGVDVCAWKGIMCTPQGHVVNITLPNMNLEGRIATELGLLEHLKTLNLSNNLLSGYLPSDLRFAPLEELDVSGNLLEGFVPPMLCLTGDVNGNGMDGQFNCDSISCPAGSFNSQGRLIMEYNHVTGEITRREECIPCKDANAVHIGATTCASPVAFTTAHFGVVSTQEAAWGGVFLGLFLIGLAAAALWYTTKIRSTHRQKEFKKRRAAGAGHSGAGGGGEEEEALDLDRIEYDFGGGGSSHCGGDHHTEASTTAASVSNSKHHNSKAQKKSAKQQEQEEMWMTAPGMQMEESNNNPENQHPPSASSSVGGGGGGNNSGNSPANSTGHDAQSQASRAVPIVRGSSAASTSSGTHRRRSSNTTGASGANQQQQQPTEEDNELWLDVPKII